MKHATLQNVYRDHCSPNASNSGVIEWLGKFGRTLTSLKQILSNKESHQAMMTKPTSVFTYKYVRFKYGVIVFPPSLQHRRMSDACSDLGDPISGGFVSKNEDGVIECHGESISLRLGSKREDTQVLDEYLSNKKSA